MKYVKNGKVYNTRTAKEIIFIDIDGEDGCMFYKTQKGSFFSINEITGEFRISTEIEVMDEYLNFLEREGRGYDKDDEVNEELPNLLKYVEDLEEA